MVHYQFCRESGNDANRRVISYASLSRNAYKKSFRDSPLKWTLNLSFKKSGGLVLKHVTVFFNLEFKNIIQWKIPFQKAKKKAFSKKDIQGTQ